MNHRISNARRGFTLAEILIVLSIILALSAYFYKRLNDNRQRAMQMTTQMALDNLKNDIEAFRIAKGSYPESLQQMVESGHISQLPADGWNSPLAYRRPGPGDQPYEIVSLGRDGKPGGSGFDADISTATTL